jgi:cytochrome c oxidase cbb3-type subunit III
MNKIFKNFLAGITALAMVIGLSGCGEKTEKQATPIIKPPVQQEVQEVRPQVPEPVLVTEDTRKTYQWYCAQCHGVEGKGNGINAKFLTVPPRNHTKAQYLETRSDEQLFEAIKFGGLSVGRAPCMPAWEHTLDDGIIQSMVQYIRELCQCEAL